MIAKFGLILFCLLAGMYFSRSSKVPTGSHKIVNAWVINLALPAVAIKYLPHIQLGPHLLLPAIAPVIVFAGGIVFVSLFLRRQAVDKATLAGMMLMAGLGNTGFVGLPLVAAYFGKENLGTAVILDQSTVFLFSTVGAYIAISASGKGKVKASELILKLARFPPLIASLLSISLLRVIDIGEIEPLVNDIAATTAPLALFSIGLQLKFNDLKSQIGQASPVLLYKLFLAPALCFIVALLFHFKGLHAQISIFQMSMPSLLSAAVIANEYDLNPKLINLIAASSIVLGLITSCIWYFVAKLAI
jgi:predicted permease